MIYIQKIPDRRYTPNQLFYIDIVFLMGMKVVAAAICILPLAGCALGIGMVFCGMLYGVSRNPMSYDTVFGLSLLGLAMIELFGFICIFGAAAIAMS